MFTLTRAPYTLSLIASVLFLSSGQGAVSATNVTVDDASSLWTYNTAAGWNVVSPTSPCAACTEKPEPAFAGSSTWHDASVVGSTASIVVRATSGTIYAILPVAEGSPSRVGANYSFSINGTPSGSFVQTITSSAYVYNFPLFSFSGKSVESPTTLSVEVGSWAVGGEGTTNPISVLILDYIKYDDGTSSGSSVSSSSTISPGGIISSFTTSGPSSTPSSSVSAVSSSNTSSATSTAFSVISPSSSSSGATSSVTSASSGASSKSPVSIAAIVAPIAVAAMLFGEVAVSWRG